jgi:hypothetical protein
MNKQNTLPRLILLLGDLAAITLFVFLGQLDHDTVDPNNPVWGLFRASFAFLLTWVIVAFIVRAYPTAAEMTVRNLLLRGLNAWLIAAPIGLLLRAFFLTRGGIPSIFMLLTLVVGGGFVLIWRLAFGLVWQWQKGKGGKQTSPEAEATG